MKEKLLMVPASLFHGNEAEKQAHDIPRTCPQINELQSIPAGHSYLKPTHRCDLLVRSAARPSPAARALFAFRRMLAKSPGAGTTSCTTSVTVTEPLFSTRMSWGFSDDVEGSDGRLRRRRSLIWSCIQKGSEFKRCGAL